VYRGFRFLASVLILALVACSKTPPDSPRPNDAPVRLAVDNRYALAIEVAVFRDGASYRLGVVHPGMQSEFVVPPAYVGGTSVEFTVTPTVLGPSYRSGPVLLAPGEIIDLKVSPVLFNSTTAIRP
jgi:hypothetical protein